MSTLTQEARYALRQLRKSPGFTTWVLGTLALGIGASTAMFGVMNAVLLRPLPFRESERLVRVLSTRNGAFAGPSPLDVRDFAAANRTFDQLVVFDAWRKNVSIANRSVEPEQRPVGLVPAGYFEALDIKPLFGRVFTNEEQRWGNQFEAIVSYAFWQAKFQGDPAVLGKSIRINDEPYTVIGVLPPGLPNWWFNGPHGVIELWTPFTPYPTVWDETSRGNRDFSSIGRLKPGVTLQQSQADLQRIAVNLDLRVIAFALGISVLSSLLFGTLPVWISLHVNPSDAFKEGGRTTVSGRKQLGRLFVASEMALAVMLLVGTGLLTRSLLRLQDQLPGFRVDHMLRTHLFLPSARYPNPASITRFLDEYSARVRQLPGVSAAVISAAYPPDDQWMQPFTIEDRPVSRLEDTPSATFNVTDPHYLHTLGIPLLQGRNFSDADTDTSLPVALINRTLAQTYFPGEDPIGKQIRLGLPQPMVSSTAPSLRFTIIGVIGDAMNRGLTLPPAPQLTTLFRQTPDLHYGFKNLIVRTMLDPLQLAPPIGQQLHLLDADLPFAEVSTMNEIMQQQTLDRRYTTGLLILFAALGLGLAAVGVYGVVSYIVAQRTNEIGLRMALGAQRSQIVGLVLKQGMEMAAAGAAVGLGGA